MISLEDCIVLCGPASREGAAVAEHDIFRKSPLPPWRDIFSIRRTAPEAIRQMIVDDVRGALTTGDSEHASELMAALRHFSVQPGPGKNEGHPPSGR